MEAVWHKFGRYFSRHSQRWFWHADLDMEVSHIVSYVAAFQALVGIFDGAELAIVLFWDLESKI